MLFSTVSSKEQLFLKPRQHSSGQKWEGGGSHSQRDTLGVHCVGFEAQHREHHQGGQNGGEEVDERHQDGVKVAVVVPLVVAGEGDDSTEAQTQGEEDLRGRVTPHLRIQHDLQLKGRQRSLSLAKVQKRHIFESSTLKYLKQKGYLRNVYIKGAFLTRLKKCLSGSLSSIDNNP